MGFVRVPHSTDRVYEGIVMDLHEGECSLDDSILIKADNYLVRGNLWDETFHPTLIDFNICFVPSEGIPFVGA
ncbi:hypothetical protein WJX73_000116 [Symbiochloris irregularis]|uniref:Uncharacterized protein n=1 Tax=Symbiochloris irregularis TaxID=706552 RepID=A0AAW1PU74_9CHLO